MQFAYMDRQCEKVQEYRHQEVSEPGKNGQHLSVPVSRKLNITHAMLSDACLAVRHGMVDRPCPAEL